MENLTGDAPLFAGRRRAAIGILAVVLACGVLAACPPPNGVPLADPGITVSPVSGLVTTEAGGTTTFTVVLHTQPTADVTIGLSSSDTSEGTASPTSLTFTTTDWSTAQTVTVSGVDDALADGDQPYSIFADLAVSIDAGYNGIAPTDVSVTNTDDEPPTGVTVSPTSGLVTTEAGGTVTFTVVLNTQPTSSVTIGLSSSDTTEGTVSPASLTFTTTDWSIAQTVTVTGADDALADGDQLYSIVTGSATSGDAGFNGLNPTDVSVTNTDDEPPAGITISPTSGLVTTEAGGTATFTVVLNTQPTSSVTIGLSSSDTTEGTVSPASLTFTTADWSSAQTVTVSGVDDALADGDQPYSIVTGSTVSGDAGYNGFDPADASVTNTDNEPPAGITVSPTSGLVTTEAGGTATFTVVLNTQPTSSVTIGLSSSDTTEGTVSPAGLTFTTVNWNSSQTVTVSGVDDALADGNQLYSIVTGLAISGDAGYNGLNPANVSVTNTDDEPPAGFTITPTSGLVTTEAGGPATFTVVLNTQPTSSVTIGLSSSDTTEGTVGPASLIFTTLNWNSAQTVTITGVDDALADGMQPYSIVTGSATSSDVDFNGLNPTDVSVTNTDDEPPAGFTISPTSGLVTTEAGGTATFTVVLNTQPTSSVTIGLSSSDTTEGTVSPASLTFTAGNWNSSQTVTITGVDDALADGDQLYSIVTGSAISGDAGYNGLNPANVSVTNTDDEPPAGVTVSPASGLVTTEAGGTATFTVVLNTQPTTSVTIGLSSSDTTEGTVSPASLTFTTVNWNSAQTVTITGVDDALPDGDQLYSIITGAAVSGDAGYNGLNPANVSVTNTDDEPPAGITVSPTSGLVTTEAGGTATFTMVLNTQPGSNVTIGLSSSDTTEGTVSPASLTFTTVNWNTAQTVTVSGVDDALVDGDQVYSIVTGSAVSGDAGYNGLNPANVSVTNTDDEPPVGTPTTWVYDFTSAGDLIPGSTWYADLVDAGETALGYWMNQTSIAAPYLFTGDFTAEFEFYLKVLPGEFINRYAFRLVDPNWANASRKYFSFAAYFTAFPVAHVDAYYDSSQGNAVYSYEAHFGSVVGIASGVNTCRVVKVGDTVNIFMNNALVDTVVIDPANLPAAGYAPLIFAENSAIEADSNFYLRKLTVTFTSGERVDHNWN